jgi:hypothetical protein
MPTFNILHQLIKQLQPIADRELEIEYLDPPAAVFSFTFSWHSSPAASCPATNSTVDSPLSVSYQVSIPPAM